MFTKIATLLRVLSMSIIKSNKHETHSALEIAWYARISIQTLLLTSLISIIPLVLVGSIAIHHAGKEAKSQAKKILQVTAEGTARDIGEYISELSHDLEFLASYIDHADLGGKENARFLAAFSASHPEILTVWAVGNDNECMDRNG